MESRGNAAPARQRGLRKEPVDQSRFSAFGRPRSPPESGWSHHREARPPRPRYLTATGGYHIRLGNVFRRRDALSSPSAATIAVTRSSIALPCLAEIGQGSPRPSVKARRIRLRSPGPRTCWRRRRRACPGAQHLAERLICRCSGGLGIDDEEREIAPRRCRLRLRPHPPCSCLVDDSRDRPYR